MHCTEAPPGGTARRHCEKARLTAKSLSTAALSLASALFIGGFGGFGACTPRPTADLAGGITMMCAPQSGMLEQERQQANKGDDHSLTLLLVTFHLLPVTPTLPSISSVPAFAAGWALEPRFRYVEKFDAISSARVLKA